MTPNVRSSFIPRSIPRHLPTGNFADTVYVPPPPWCFIPLHFMPSEHHKATYILEILLVIVFYCDPLFGLIVI